MLIGTTPEHAEKFRFVQKCTGGILAPFDSYLLLRGVKTLAVRMKQHDANGRVVADWLVKRFGPEKVFYPGLKTHPQHELAKWQQKGFGSMLAFEFGRLKKLIVCFTAEALLFCGVAGRSGDASMSSGDDDACGGGGGGAEEAGDYGWADSDFGGD